MSENKLSTKSVISRTGDSLTRDLRVWLVESGLYRPEQVASLSALADKYRLRLDQLLRQENALPEEKLLEAFSMLSSIPVHSLSTAVLDPEVLGLLPASLVARHNVLPLYLQGKSLVVAIDRIPNLRLEDDIRLAYAGRFSWILCSQPEIAASIQHHYGLGLQAVSKGDEDPDVIALFEEIIHEAITRNSSDIHIEPFENELRLRYRVDGILQTVPLAEGVSSLHRALVQRIKVLAECNLAERRLPQDGRFSVESGGRTFDLRVSILPSRHGQAVTIRILNRQDGFRKLNNLGLHAGAETKLHEILELSHGLVLFTGPTGSGKTTSLYAALHELNDESRQIITLEDPVEYDMLGVHQVQVNTDIGLTFASGLRSMLRHDPDVVLIGEIRDGETAEIAISASLTGHLVFSTLHTNDAASTIPRLVDMGVEPHLVATSVEAVVAQRLVRRVCSECSVVIPVPDILTDEWSDVRARCGLDDAQFLEGRGCARCRFTGYDGRFPIFELIRFTDELRILASRNAPAAEIRQAARLEGMRSLREDGWRRAANGETSVQEVLRVTQRARNFSTRR